jgi:hypothetical protein
MLVRDAMATRMSAGGGGASEAGEASLPLRLKTERMNVRNGLMKRLASSRAFALGDRSGVLRAAQNRSGGPFVWTSVNG